MIGCGKGGTGATERFTATSPYKVPQYCSPAKPDTIAKTLETFPLNAYTFLPFKKQALHLRVDESHCGYNKNHAQMSCGTYLAENRVAPI